jgi:hypothetical protein
MTGLIHSSKNLTYADGILRGELLYAGEIQTAAAVPADHADI